jgi:phosphoribosylformylglycinamidine synthase subunit PurS
MKFTVHLVVTLKPVVNDPQGLVVQSGLRQLGFDAVDNVRVGKYIEFILDAPDDATARAQVTQMCERLLRNPVIEDYEIKGLLPESPDGVLSAGAHSPHGHGGPPA